VVVGDHGEGLMDHGHPFHGAQIHEEAVRVPFVVRWPGHIEGGRVIDSPTSIGDLAPALLQLAGEGAGGLDASARERAGRWFETVGTNDEPVFLYRRHYEPAELSPGFEVAGEQFGIRDGRWKLIEGPDEGRLELYDLETDPEERVNLAEREPARTAALRARLARWRSEADGELRRWQAEAGVGGPSRPGALDDEARARLEALGYVE
jgi:arylsulfatase A-like enzyme